MNVEHNWVNRNAGQYHCNTSWALTGLASIMYQQRGIAAASYASEKANNAGYSRQ
jgi:hypothetical protein